jgi:hypothetical protein
MERNVPPPERSRPGRFQANLELAMNNTENDKNQADKEEKNDDKLPLEGLAKTIDPPRREVSDEELTNPVKMTPQGPVDNRA